MKRKILLPCGHVGVHYAKGLCSSCYDRRKWEMRSRPSARQKRRRGHWEGLSESRMREFYTRIDQIRAKRLREQRPVLHLVK